jgi:endoglucanase Acf2
MSQKSDLYKIEEYLENNEYDYLNGDILMFARSIVAKIKEIENDKKLQKIKEAKIFYVQFARFVQNEQSYGVSYEQIFDNWVDEINTI